jgi:hypothetical protein
MGARQLSRWQKASALVPMAVLVGAWGVVATNSGLATASGGSTSSEIPEVPATAFEQPASVQPNPAGVDQRAGAAGTVSTLSSAGIPASALYAYRRAETLLGKADESCRLPWNLVAAIGRVESNHGRTGGNALDDEGVAKPGIYGVPLDGKGGNAKITDSDGGKLDKNTVLDRAVGPMQFIPSTWATVGVDSDNDGKKNPQDIDDAATAAGIYLCAGEGDVSQRKGAAEAVKRYNHSDAYVDLVLRISEAYAKGDFTQSPNGAPASSVLTSQSLDQTFTPQQRAKATKAEREASKPKPKPKPGSPAGGGGSTGESGGTDGGTGVVPGTPGGSTGGGSGSGSGGNTLGGGVQDVVEGTPLKPLAPVLKPVTGLLSLTEATLRCTVTTKALPTSTYRTRFNACVKDLTT